MKLKKLLPLIGPNIIIEIKSLSDNSVHVEIPANEYTHDAEYLFFIARQYLDNKVKSIDLEKSKIIIKIK